MMLVALASWVAIVNLSPSVNATGTAFGNGNAADAGGGNYPTAGALLPNRGAVGSQSNAQGGAGESITIQIKVVNGRYDPNVITVKQGTKVRLELDRGSFVGCMSTFNIWGLNIRQNVQQNNIVEFVADKPGTYKTSCPMGMGDGKFIVEAASGNEAAAAQNTAQAVAAAPKAGAGCGMGGGCGCGG